MCIDTWFDHRASRPVHLRTAAEHDEIVKNTMIPRLIDGWVGLTLVWCGIYAFCTTLPNPRNWPDDAIIDCKINPHWMIATWLTACVAWSACVRYIRPKLARIEFKTAEDLINSLTGRKGGLTQAQATQYAILGPSYVNSLGSANGVTTATAAAPPAERKSD